MADVYVVIYATYGGKTGHAGIAIDKYVIKTRDCKSCVGGVVYDTVKTGALLYFDMWPQKDHFNKQRLFEHVPAAFYRLPGSSSESPITTGSLMRKGIPHEEAYACDGLLRFKSSYEADEELKAFLDQLIVKQKTFHAIDFNCADFVEQALEFHLKTDIKADEKVFMNIYTTTPNQLYKTLSQLPDVGILKNPGKKINGSFWEEKIIKW